MASSTLKRTDRAELSLHGADDDTGLYSCAASSSTVKVSTGPRARAHRVKPTILGTKPSGLVLVDATSYSPTSRLPLAVQTSNTDYSGVRV